MPGSRNALRKTRRLPILPQWLAKLIGNRTYLGATMPPQAWANFLRERFAEGARRKALLRIVGKLATVPGNCPQIVTELMLAWNVAKCDAAPARERGRQRRRGYFHPRAGQHKWLKVDDYV